MDKKAKTQVTTLHKVMTVIGAVLCVILIPVLIVNCTLIVKSLVNKDEVPNFAGIVPMVVLSDSMFPEIESGDLIICNVSDASEVEVGDVISFFDPSGDGTVVTHRVIDILAEEGTLKFQTRGDMNNAADSILVPEENLVGIYSGTHFAGVGSVVMFLSTTWGLVVCVVLPLVLLIAYDFIRSRMYERRKEDDTEALLAELAALRAEKAANEAAANKEE